MQMQLECDARDKSTYVVMMLVLVVRRCRRFYLVVRTFGCEPLTTAALKWLVKTSQLLHNTFPRTVGEGEETDFVRRAKTWSLGRDDEDDFGGKDYGSLLRQCDETLIARTLVAAFDVMRDLKYGCEIVFGTEAPQSTTTKFMVMEFVKFFPALLNEAHCVESRLDSVTNTSVTWFLGGDKVPSVPVGMSTDRWVAVHGLEMGREILAHFARQETALKVLETARAASAAASTAAAPTPPHAQRKKR